MRLQNDASLDPGHFGDCHGLTLLGQVWRKTEISMGTEQTKPVGPDLATGVPIADLPDGHMLVGHVGDEPVVLARRGDRTFAIGARCSHYGGPLAEGLMVDDTVRCPWHHACFSLRTGEALHPPALSPVACWAVERRDRKLFVTAKKEAPAPKKGAAPSGRPGCRENCHHRRWRGRICRGGEIAARAISGKHCHAEQR
jgi:nitrite reductase/ring-hydroxylating ferredoxin subunit